MTTRDRIPSHLRRFVVEQDPGAYDEIDQSVWRFVLLQMFQRGIETAHPIYARGLEQTGISIDRIPSIDEMDACLSRFGWGAVAVDGFIPPRAFQEFQALGILTIAADMRRAEHLAYTPAPDIIHESAGHAPIVPDPDYRAFLQRFGEIGARAFSSLEDQRVYEAIRALSEIKEDPASDSAAIAHAERALGEAQKSVRYASEAALLSRLHWWTVEYGLVGTPDHYKIYGAGLLSSLGESHFLPDSNVRKLPLSARCIDVAYDITAPQPQLFVAESFAQLHDVLDEVADGLAQRCGGAHALERALMAQEVATLELTSGVELIGVLDAVLDDVTDPAWVRLRGPCALAHRGKLLPGQDRNAHPEGYGTPLGRLADGTSLSELSESNLRILVSNLGRELVLRFRSGVQVRGELLEARRDAAGRLLLLTLRAARVTRGEQLLFDPRWGRFDLAVGERVERAYAGPSDPAYWPETEFPTGRVPKPKARQGEEARMLQLYRDALALWRDPRREALVPGFDRIHAELRTEHPQDWLLRWNLLESLRKIGYAGPLACELRRELLEIEPLAPRELPITTGLRYLDQAYGSLAAG